MSKISKKKSIISKNVENVENFKKTIENFEKY